MAHTGRPAGRVNECLVDEAGRVYLACTAGLGLVHSLDVEALARQIDQGRWTPREVLAADLPGAYGFVPSPQAAAGPLPA